MSTRMSTMVPTTKKVNPTVNPTEGPIANLIQVANRVSWYLLEKMNEALVEVPKLT
jgi:hypothetical protein